MNSTREIVMKKILTAGSVAAVCLFVAVGSVVAEEYTTTTYDPVLDAYRYTAPPNSWYAAKVKPKLKTQTAAKIPVEAKTLVNAESVSIPEPEAEPATKAETPASPVLDEAIANSPVAKSPEPTRALPFWQDILPEDAAKAQ